MKTAFLFLALHLLSFSFSQNENRPHPNSFSRVEIDFESKKYAVYQNAYDQIFMTEISKDATKEKLLTNCDTNLYMEYTNRPTDSMRLKMVSEEEIKNKIDRPELLEKYLRKENQITLDSTKK